MSPVLAIPTTTVAKLITGTMVRMRLDERVADRLHLDAELQPGRTEQDPHDYGDQNLYVALPEHRANLIGAPLECRCGYRLPVAFFDSCCGSFKLHEKRRFINPKLVQISSYGALSFLRHRYLIHIPIGVISAGR